MRRTRLGDVYKSGYLYVYVSNEIPDIDVFFDNLQVTHIRGPLAEETHYYPFGLQMSGISSKALNFGDPGNKRKYNGIEYDSTFAIDEDEAQLRNLDPQVGRWWEIDPKIDNMEMWSPYASNYDNPITYNDPLGDEGDDCCKGTIVGDILDAGKKVLISAAGMLDGAVNTVSMGLVSSDPFNFGKSLSEDDKEWFDGGVSVGKVIPLFVSPRGSAAENPEPAPASGVKLKTNDPEPLGPNKVQASSTHSPTTTPEVGNKNVSPNVQKALNTIKQIKAEGGVVKPNPTKPNQELNITVQQGKEKIDVRVETHVVPKKYGGNGTTPQRHLNVDLHPNKDALPNKGHKILENE